MSDPSQQPWSLQQIRFDLRQGETLNLDCSVPPNYESMYTPQCDLGSKVRRQTTRMTL